MCRQNAASLVSVVSGLVLASAAFAGPLTPPAGPVASTYKTLTEVEPRVAINATNTPGDADSLYHISQPGSYYLTGNLTGVSGKHGIEIAASGVTLDLNGFELAGVASGVTVDGVRVDTTGRSNISVRNGTVRNWSGTGINLLASTPLSCVVTDVRATSNGGAGISVGATSQVIACSASLNTANGIYLSFNCTATNCVVATNGQNGIYGSVVNAISHCTAYENGADGISAGIGSKITDCVAYDNTDEGFVMGSSGTISGCTASVNGGNGIELYYGSSAINCSSQNNMFHGITGPDRCYIVGNTCVRNGFSGGPASGIYLSGNSSRIEGNTCIENDRGIELDGTRNFVVRNTCGGNYVSNWDIAANNICGPILNRSAPASAAILGDSAPSSLGTTDANANFTQ